MSDEVKSAYVESTGETVEILPDDREAVNRIQSVNDNLVQVRQEIGRIYQVLNNLVARANDYERELSQERKNLADKYNLDKGQWALDFEQNVFTKVPGTGPVIP